MAAEKENKTFETLLAAPVSRGAVVTAKMLAAAIVALLAAVVYMFGMRAYMEGLTGGVDESAVAEVAQGLGLMLGAGDYAAIGLTLFLGILCALAIALILGAFADSVRAVGAILTPLMLVLLVPYLLVLFLDFSSLSPALRYGVLAIPFSYPFMVTPNLFLGETGLVWWGIAYEALWFAVLVTIAARIFSSDRILTMRLRLGRRGAVRE